MCVIYIYSGLGSSVVIATDNGLEGPAIENGGRDFPSAQNGTGVHPAYCKLVTETLPWVK